MDSVDVICCCTGCAFALDGEAGGPRYRLSASGLYGPVHSVSRINGWFLACWGVHLSRGLIRNNPLTKSTKHVRDCRSTVNFAP